MFRRHFIHAFSSVGIGALLPTPKTSASVVSDRAFWVQMATKIAHPVLEALSQDALKEKMPVQAVAENQVADRQNYTYLEAFGRLLCGISPWLALPDDATPESRARMNLRNMALQGLAIAVNPSSKNYMNFERGYQPLVDASFLAYALLRAPSLWDACSSETKQHIIQAFHKTRTIRPWFNNWLLFSAMIEAFFLKIGEPADKMRLDYAIRQHLQWYKGDGIFGDGPDFHWDYYNSYVIQPYLLDILQLLAPKDAMYKPMLEQVQRYAVRYAAIQERLVAPDGTFPVIGRSICYRAGAFQHLANMALQKQLPVGVSPAQVRGALTAVLRKTTESPQNFDANGWLKLGLNGNQPHLAETYISTGSLYLCATVFLPLGLPESDPFWALPSEDWTSRKAWSGIDLPADSSVK